MAEPGIASTTGAEHSANLRRRNVPGAEDTGGVPSSSGADDEKKAKPQVCVPVHSIRLLR